MGTPLIITVQPTPETTHYVSTVTLEQARYNFEFYSNAVTQGWAFDLSNDGGTSVARGIALTAGIDLLYPYRHLDFPPGQLYVRDKGLNGADPGLTSFIDGTAALYYLEST